MKRFIRIESSAGGGKTKSIVDRYIELISNKVKFNRILAITFTNNASEEMKRRILRCLKERAFKGDDFIYEVIDGKDGIIENFSDFSVKTIDAFLYSLLKSSALDLSLPPEPKIEENVMKRIKEVMDEFLVKASLCDRLKDTVINFLKYLSDFSESLDPYRSIEEYFRDFIENESVLLPNYDFNPIIYREFFFTLKSQLNSNKKKDKVIFLSDISNLLYEYVLKSKVPYLFFKLGEKFYHFLIDEFQDTSLIQWNNLKPLIENALSGYDMEGNKGTFFYVGDPKQSIYRWRGTRWELFDVIHGDFKGKIEENEFSFEYLSENKRSGKIIVEFVNDLFDITNLSEYFKVLSDDKKKNNYLKYFNEVIKVYRNVKQIADELKPYKGYIEFKVIKGSKIIAEEEILSYLDLILDDLNKRKRSLGDIAILERLNSDCQRVVNYLLSKGYPVFTSYNISIESLPLLKTIYYFLKILINERDIHSLLNLLQTEYFTKIFSLDEKDVKKFILSENKDLFKFCKIFPSFDFAYKYFKNLHKNFSLYYLLLEFDYLFNISKRFKDDYFHLLSLLKVISQEVENVSTYEFIRKFERAEYIFSPSSENAIKVLTLHKAKGLEFDVVISLFAPMTLFAERSKFIVNDKFLDKQEIYLKREVKNDVKLHNDVFNIIQELNLLYVLLTRAREEIYFVLGSKFKKTFSYFVMNYLKKRFGEKDLYTFGEKRVCEKKDGKFNDMIRWERENPISVKNLHKNLFVKSEFESVVKRHSEVTRGEWIHFVLSNIKNLKEENFKELLSESFEKAKIFWRGFRHFDEELFEKIDYFETKLTKPFLKEFFFTDSAVETELEVMDDNGAIFRFDRLILDDVLKVIEFKTGEEVLKSHFDQIKCYMVIAEKIFAKKVKGYLVYLDREEVYEF
ncbi:MAG: UvrD-helicase domain-containing protein [Candidatus Hydrothermales bacterium]